ncbi:energy transducer TonB [Brevundimonas lutea]|uniref:energy transducer TonB n=1 Tax=Brevundimonas lutea TaxID=2293980 RepID=UPI000F03710B|nr:energy transducer TonB [Brevundimonas lutea]
MLNGFRREDVIGKLSMKGAGASVWIGVLACCSHATAQPAETVDPVDWDLIQQHGDTAAVVVFDNDLAVLARCSAGVFDLTLNGLPEDRGENGLRSLRVELDGAEEGFELWHTSADGKAAFSRTPARLARRLREGGELTIIVPATDGAPARRYLLPLSASPEAVDRALLACGKPAIDPRDALVDDSASDRSPPVWRVTPRLNYPEPALRAGAAQGAVTLSCLAMPDGRLRDCVVESEFPPGVGFGAESLRAARRARVATSPDASPRMMIFSTGFRVD